MMLEISMFLIRSSESLSCFHANTGGGGWLCCTGVAPICCSTHANLTNQKGILFLHGAVRLDIYLFMKGLPTFSVDGPMIIKTWVSS